MNPYAAASGSPKAAPVKTTHDVFAADVFREEPVGRKGAGETAAIGEEIARLRAELRGETRALRSRMAKPRAPTELLAEITALRAAVDELLVTPKRGDGVASAIRARGIEGPCASLLARGAKSKDAASVRGDATVRLRTATASLVTTTSLPASLRGRERGIIALVGPAGVGKTTTAAKLAALAKMAKKSVALVSCDSFRVGAMDQLAAYAELLDARMHVAATQQDLLDVLATEDADVVIVDTSGRAVTLDATEAVLCFPEVREGARGKRRVDVLLCVSASLRAADATRVFRDFAMVEPTALAITKLDETDAPAGIAHAAFATRLPVSVLCAGQRVPEDIAGATDGEVAARLFPCSVNGALADREVEAP